MSSTIKAGHLKRQQQQDLAQAKSDSASQHISSLKRMKEAVQQSKAELKVDKKNEAVVNHIKKSSVDSDYENYDDSSDAPTIENNRLYTRQARFERYETPEPASSLKESPLDYDPEIITNDDDVFYAVQDRGNHVSEDNFGYYIDAYAPEYEKDALNISIQHNKVIVSGSRKAQNELQEVDRKITTNNFQTFREEFLFDQPVIADGMTRERDGDYIRFFIPKLASKTNNS